MTIDCRKWEERVEAYIDGELDPTAGEAFEGHLDGCATCRREVQAAHTLRGALRSLPEPRAPADRVREVLDTVREGDRKSWRVADRLRPRPHPAWWVAAAALVVLVVGLALVDEPSGPGGEADRVAVARATLEVKLALAHVARAQRRVTAEIEREISPRVLLEPATAGLVRTLGGDEAAGTGEDGRG